MQVGDQVQVLKGPYGGMTGTITESRGVRINRRGKFKDKDALETAIVTVRTKLNRYVKVAETNLEEV